MIFKEIDNIRDVGVICHYYICKILDEKVEEFLKRLIEVKIRYLLVDATYFKVRCGTQYKNRALLVVVGIREDGLREILGASIAESEDSGYW